MNYTVNITAKAKADIRAIFFGIAKISGNKALAKKYIIELEKDIKNLSIFPNSGALPKDRVLISNGFRFIVHKNYLVFYLVNEDQKSVNVVTVFNAKRDYIHILK